MTERRWNDDREGELQQQRQCRMMTERAKQDVREEVE